MMPSAHIHRRLLRTPSLRTVLICILVFLLGIIAITIRAQYHNEVEVPQQQKLCESMVLEFSSHFGDAPAQCSPRYGHTPDDWPDNPFSSEQIQDIKKAISKYNFLYPKRAVSFDSVKRAYGRDLARNISTGWRIYTREMYFAYWYGDYKSGIKYGA